MSDIYAVLCTICRGIWYLPEGSTLKDLDREVISHVDSTRHPLTRHLGEGQFGIPGVEGVTGVTKGHSHTSEIITKRGLVERQLR